MQILIGVEWLCELCAKQRKNPSVKRCIDLSRSLERLFKAYKEGFLATYCEVFAYYAIYDQFSNFVLHNTLFCTIWLITFEIMKFFKNSSTDF